jgi:hypothetical protein
MPNTQGLEPTTVYGDHPDDLGATTLTGTTPYSSELSKMLGEYGPALQQRSKQRRDVLDQAQERLLSRIKDPMTDAVSLFKIAAAFGKPTRTGGFGETMGNVAEAAGNEAERRQQQQWALQDLQQKYQTAGIDQHVEGLENQIGVVTKLAQINRGRVPEVMQLTEALNGLPKGHPSIPVLQSRLDFLSNPNRGQQTNPPEIMRLAAVLEDPNATQSQKRIAQQAITKANRIPPEAAPKSLIPTKLSNQEIKMKSDTIDKIDTGRDIIGNLERAIKLSPIAYTGRTAGAREFVGSVIPGISSSDAQNATTELDNILKGNALASLKATFGGNPTEGERKILLEIQGAITQTPRAREKIFKEAQRLAARRVARHQEKLKDIESGSYSSRSPDDAVIEDAPEEVSSQDQETLKRGRRGFASGGAVHMADGGGLTPANIGRAGMQGATLGFGDEAIARVRSKLENRPYEDLLAEERASYKQFSDQYPLTSLGAEVVGGIIPTAASFAIPGAQPLGVARAGQTVGRVAKAFQSPVAKLAGTSGGVGFVSGMGAGEGDMSNRLGSGVETGLTSAVAGPVLSKAATGAGSAGREIYSRLLSSPDASERRAAEKVLQAMGRDSINPQDLRTSMAKDRALGVPSMLMDSSPALKSLGEAVVTYPGSGGKILGEKLNQRLDEGRERVGARALQHIGKGVDFTKEESNLVGKLRSNASNAYDEAYAHGEINDPRITHVLHDDTFKKAYVEAQSIASKEARAAELRGEDPSRFMLKQMYQVTPDGVATLVSLPDVRTLDYVKRGIDAMIDKGYSGSGMSKAEASALKDLKRAFVSTIDEATTVDGVSKYAQARAKYAGDREVLDALQLGKNDYLSPKMLPEQAKNLVAGMSGGERDALRAGVAQSILSKVMDSPQQINAAQRVIGSPSTRKRLSVLFDKPEDYQLFENALTRESELFRNAQDIVRGSRTANKAAAMQDLKNPSRLLDVAGDAVDMSIGGTGTIIGKVLKFIQSGASLDEKTAGNVAHILKAGSPNEVGHALNLLEAHGKDFAKRQSVRGMTERGISAETGILSAPEPSAEYNPEPAVDVDQIMERLKSEQQ